jgi:hypothetical protein
MDLLYISIIVPGYVSTIIMVKISTCAAISRNRVNSPFSSLSPELRLTAIVAITAKSSHVSQFMSVFSGKNGGPVRPDRDW